MWAADLSAATAGTASAAVAADQPVVGRGRSASGLALGGSRRAGAVVRWGNDSSEREAEVRRKRALEVEERWRRGMVIFSHTLFTLVS